MCISLSKWAQILRCFPSLFLIYSLSNILSRCFAPPSLPHIGPLTVTVCLFLSASFRALFSLLQVSLTYLRLSLSFSLSLALVLKISFFLPAHLGRNFHTHTHTHTNTLSHVNTFSNLKILYQENTKKHLLFMVSFDQKLTNMSILSFLKSITTLTRPIISLSVFIPTKVFIPPSFLLSLSLSPPPPPSSSLSLSLSLSLTVRHACYSPSSSV